MAQAADLLFPGKRSGGVRCFRVWFSGGAFSRRSWLQRAAAAPRGSVSMWPLGLRAWERRPPSGPGPSRSSGYGSGRQSGGLSQSGRVFLTGNERAAPCRGSLGSREALEKLSLESLALTGPRPQLRRAESRDPGEAAGGTWRCAGATGAPAPRSREARRSQSRPGRQRRPETA